uniref:Uncharacterized protein n=1 Tax=Hyaloperonospora arabidopsidis (strain Emoy2) TaxID=559515 RepID=M4BXM0_HYAAE
MFSQHKGVPCYNVCTSRSKSVASSSSNVETRQHLSTATDEAQTLALRHWAFPLMKKDAAKGLAALTAGLINSFTTSCTHSYMYNKRTRVK